jgi:hypothetical protein
VNGQGYLTYIVRNTVGFYPVGVFINTTYAGLAAQIVCSGTIPACAQNHGLTDSVVVNPNDSVRVLIRIQTRGATTLTVPFTPSTGIPLYSRKTFVVPNRTQYGVGGDLAPYQTSAMHPFSASYTHSTPSYITMETPRNVTLAYSSDRAAPFPLIGIDLTLPRNSIAAKSYTLSAMNGSTAVQFSNGETFLHFAGTLAPAVQSLDSACVRFRPMLPMPTCVRPRRGIRRRGFTAAWICGVNPRV